MILVLEFFVRSLFVISERNLADQIESRVLAPNNFFGSYVSNCLMSFLSLTGNSELFKCCTYLKKGSEYTRTETLRKFGTNTEIDFNEFYDNFQSFQQESVFNAKTFYQITREKTRKGKKGGKGICPHCKRNHWKEGCPNREYPTTETANLICEKLEGESEDIVESAWLASDKNANKSNDTWYLDSGCTSNIGCKMDSFKELELGDGPKVARLAASAISQDKGRVEVQNIYLSDTLFVPSAPCNLVSISKVTSKANRHAIFTKNGAYLTLLRPDIFKHARKISVLKNRLYELSVESPKDVSLWTVDVPPKLLPEENEEFLVSSTGEYNHGNVWHARIGHPGRAVCQTLAKVADLPPLSITNIPVCSACALSKGKVTKGHMSDSICICPI